jgi:acetyl-CoA carboxylase biotin carboxyl carrier protein
LSEPAGWVTAVRRIVAEVTRSDATEFELRQGAFRVRLKRQPGAGLAPSATRLEDRTEQAHTARQRVLAPLTGIFYRSPNPTAPPYVEVGDWVEPATVIGLIETMKVFNEVTADASGRITAFLADSGQLVHAGDGLLSIEPGERPDGGPGVVS